MGKSKDISLSGQDVEKTGDKTKGKVHSDSLQISDASFHTIFNSVNDIIIVHDATTGKVLDVNQSAIDIFGYSREEFNRMNVSDWSPDDVPHFSDDWAARGISAAADGQVIDFQWQIKKKNGDIFWVEANLTQAQLDNRQVVLAVGRDITTRKKLEEQLRQTHKMEAIGRLASGVAHDFNNILTAINGYADLILATLPPDHPIVTDVTEIQQAGQRAAALTDQLLAFGRKQPALPRVIDLNQRIADSKNMLSRIIGEDIHIRFVPTDTLWPTSIDPAQVDQILINLAVNARDAMPEGGQLTIETRNINITSNAYQEPKELPIGEYVVLSVSDNGCGMDEATRNQAMEPFFTTKTRDGSAGLGLSTLYGISKQNGGTLTVYSELGVGSTFKVYLPHCAKTDAVEVSAAQKSLAASKIENNETILVIEDDETVRKLTVRMLETQGYKVHEARDGFKALELFETIKDEVHIILTDVIMPGMNGREVAEAILKIKPDMPIIFMSGYTENVIAHHGVINEDIDFLQKPFSAELLLLKVKEVLGRRR
ncbi:response regulator [Myxococcota bacterium]|nr:response regulator [Myxococcota bacterium]